MRNHLLSITRRTIPYLPDLRPIAGSVTASILMQQLDYWFSQKPDGFYKFLSPCGHEAYREGDSWEEELAFSVDEFRTAFDRIGVRHGSKKAYKAAVASGSEFIAEAKDGTTTVKFYSSYHDKIKGLTFYFRNHPVVDERLNSLVSGNFPVNGKSPSTEMEKPSSVNGESPVHLYTEITPEITPEITSSPTPPKGKESVEEKRPRNGTKPPAPNINAVATLVKEEVIQQSTVICEDKSSAAPVNQIVEYSINPDEQFKNGRRLCPHKNTYMSKSSDPWMEGGNPIPVFKLWVLSQINRDPKKVTNLPNVSAELRNNYQRAQDWWDGFLADTQQRFESMERRLLSGGLPREGELEELASVAPFAPELAGRVIEMASNPQLVSTTATPALPSPTPALPKNFEGSPDTYREYKPELEVSQEEAQANLLRLKEMMAAAAVRKLPPPQEPKPINQLDQLNADLADPLIGRSLDIQFQARRFLESNVGYVADQDEEGIILNIVQF